MNAGHKSFADIVRMYQQVLYWHIRRVVLVHEDAEDILQESPTPPYVSIMPVWKKPIMHSRRNLPASTFFLKSISPK